MIGQSRLAWVGIHAGIAFFRAITPLSILYCAARLLWLRDLPKPFIALNIYAAVESAFYFLVYLPRRSLLKRPATHPPILSRHERRHLFENCVTTIPDIERFAVLWSPAKPSEIKRENVKDWLCWAVFSRQTWTPEEDDELESYISEAEEIFDIYISKGRGDAKALCLTLDSFRTLHRPLFLYVFGIAGADLITQVYLRYHGFSYFRRPSVSSIFITFPFTPLSLCTTHASPAKHLSYYHRAHTSKRRLPILFIHGIGVGLQTYIQFMKEFTAASDAGDSTDGQVGFIALEILPVSFRMTHPALSKDEMCHEILQILQKHKWDNFVLVGQSYGTIISTHLLHNPSIGPMIGPILLIDPVVFLLHLPDVVYNFMRRPPRHANEWMHYYFANTDLDVAHTLARRFFWTENILWKEEMSGKRVTAVLAEKDIIVDTNEVGRYLTRDEDVTALMDKRDDGWKEKEWTGGTGLEILWLENCDHAQEFYKPRERRKLVEVLLEYCKNTDEAL